MLRVALGIVGVCYALNCFAGLVPKSSAQTCAVLYDTQLRAGDWTLYQDGKEGCTSGARLIKPDSVDSNLISFSAEGARGTPSRVVLVLDVKLPSDDIAAKRELIRATKRLGIRVLGFSIPHTFDEAIMRGAPISLVVGSGRAILTRTVVNKQSYLLSVVME